jgi:nucleotide-binding universal stress UspA family protein
MIRKLLVALDGSTRAPRVFAAAAELAQRFGAAIHPFRAIHIPPEYPPAAHVEAADELPRHMVDVAVSELLDLAKIAAPELVREPIVRAGQAWRMILQVSEELDVDLIVMGSHGYHGLDRVLGTTAGKVSNLSRRSVLVVHDRDTRSHVDVEAPGAADSKGQP